MNGQEAVIEERPVQGPQRMANQAQCQSSILSLFLPRSQTLITNLSLTPEELTKTLHKPQTVNITAAMQQNKGATSES